MLPTSFSPFPALLVVTAIVSFFPFQDLMNQIVARIAPFVPGDTNRI